MKPDTIEEIIDKISIVKLLMSSGVCPKELVEAYSAKIETWEAEIDVINALTLESLP